MKKGSKHIRKHEGREDLIGENNLSDIGQIIFALIFFSVWISDTFLFEFSTFPNNYLPLAVRIPLGIILVVVSGYLARTGVSIVFGEQREKPSVIRKSVFGIIRHPMYFSEVLLYLGFLMFSLSLAAFIVWTFAVVFLYYISRYEEMLLTYHFGDEYKKYMNEVPMWIPRIRKN